MTEHPSSAEIEGLAMRAFQSIPAELRAPLDNLMIQVEEAPDDATCAALDLASPLDLLGIYHGHSLDRKSVHDVGTWVDMIFLYRQPILQYRQDTGEDLYHVVRHVLIHEIGHHFGFSDADMAAIEAQTC